MGKNIISGSKDSENEEPAYTLIYRAGRSYGVRFRGDKREYCTREKSKAGAEFYAKRVLAGDIIPTRVQKNYHQFRLYANDFFRKNTPGSYQWNCRKRGKRYPESHYREMQDRLDHYIMPRFGSYAISAIKPKEVEIWFLDLRSYATGKPLSASYRNKILFTLKVIMDYAVKDEIISENKIRDVKGISESDFNRRPAFNERDLQKLFPIEIWKRLKIWGDLMWATYFSIQYDTGFRPSEVCGISKLNFFPGYSGIYTKQAAVNGILQNRIKTTGTGLDYKVGILSETTKYLVQMLAERTEGEYLFKAESGMFIFNNTANKHLRSVAKKQGISMQNRTQYCFRHSFNTMMLQHAPSASCRELMGLTESIANYDHRTPDMVLEQLQSVRGIVNNRIS